jgi:hypothetical protein
MSEIRCQKTDDRIQKDSILDFRFRISDFGFLEQMTEDKRQMSEDPSSLFELRRGTQMTEDG